MPAGRFVGTVLQRAQECADMERRPRPLFAAAYDLFGDGRTA
jgi:hypothetical protein